jgi:hypothetical protein
VFPVEAQINARAPRSIALETATVIPRSLNDPVGLRPSFLMNTSQPRPTRALNFGENTSGVSPSPKEMTALQGGRNSRKRSITPLPAMLRIALPAGLPRFIFTASIDDLSFESIQAIVEPQLQL